VGAGPEHTCAILDNRQVKCWGLNLGGNLGIGDMQLRGKSPGDMGDNLPIVDLGPGRSVLALSVGSGSNCALLDDDQVKCWGANSSGELGLGNKTGHGAAPGEMGDALPDVVIW
jgi:alpha-tubulin suppressor-like RCC1 family protein